VQNPNVTYAGGEDGANGHCGFSDFRTTDPVTVTAEYPGSPGYLPSSSATVDVG
jgi:hypothetical protein